MFRTQSTPISHRKSLAEHWDLPNSGIFYFKDVASAVLVDIERPKNRKKYLDLDFCTEACEIPVR
jgi:hypothetical protein